MYISKVGGVGVGLRLPYRLGLSSLAYQIFFVQKSRVLSSGINLVAIKLTRLT